MDNRCACRGPCCSPSINDDWGDIMNKSKLIKKTALLSLALVFALILAGCGATTGKTTEGTTGTTAEETAATTGILSAEQTAGIDKLKTVTDYSVDDNWLAKPAENDKAVDVIYLYPTAYTRANDGEDVICDVDNASMRTKAQQVFKNQASVFAASCNVYAPYYRQVDGSYALTISDADNDALLRYTASTDPAAALDYYFQDLNNGRPYILAGHSQGSENLIYLLSDYMKAHPDYYKNMVAAYVIGYSVTSDYLDANPHLKFATGESDTGVIVSYNTEGLGNADAHNAVVRSGAISINPLNWMRDDTYAGVESNKGSLQSDGTIGAGIADAQVNTQRGVVVCSSVDPASYAISAQMAALFGTESYHGSDYSFYYANIQENVAKRIAAFK